MTQEDKELLLKDLCARLPYEVKCEAIYWRNRNKGIWDLKRNKICINFSNISILNRDDIDVRPYLFPLSSMTDEQKIEYHELIHELNIKAIEGEISNVDCSVAEVDWLNAHHFDYRGLIEKGLAIDATGLNIY